MHALDGRHIYIIVSEGAGEYCPLFDILRARDLRGVRVGERARLQSPLLVWCNTTYAT